MGDSEEGGGGSVYWRLEAKKANGEHDQNGNHVKQKGKDNDEKAQRKYDFTVSVLVPDDVDPDSFLRYLKDQLKLTDNRKRVYFNHPILEEEAQIRVSWGDSSHHEGNGGKPTQFPFPISFPRS